MVHAFRLIEATGWRDEAPRLGAAVYLHDLARTHDVRCYRHGADAVRRFETLPHLDELSCSVAFRTVITRSSSLPSLTTVCPNKLDRAHPHWCLTSLLKDADGL